MRHPANMAVMQHTTETCHDFKLAWDYDRTSFICRVDIAFLYLQSINILVGDQIAAAFGVVLVLLRLS